MSSRQAAPLILIGLLGACEPMPGDGTDTVGGPRSQPGS